MKRFSMTDNEHNAAAIEEYKNKVQRQAKRIAELEAENKHLEDYIDAYQKSEAINIAKLDKKDERIKELEAENERLKAEREEANSWDDSWKMAEQITQLEKCLVNARNENAKLKCLALHAMSEYFGYKTLFSNKKTNRTKYGQFANKFHEAYRKAKADLKGTK